MKKTINKIGTSHGIIISNSEMEENKLVLGDLVDVQLKKIKRDYSWKKEPATEKQIEVLRKIRINLNENITKGEADILIKENSKKEVKESFNKEPFPDY